MTAWLLIKIIIVNCIKSINQSVVLQGAATINVLSSASYALLNSHVFRRLANCPWLTSLWRIWCGRLFQTVGAAERKLRLPNVLVLVGGTISSPWRAERSLARPATVSTGIHTSVKYAGHAPWTHLNAIVAILYVIRCRTGNQWSVSRRVGVFFRTGVRIAAFAMVVSSFV